MKGSWRKGPSHRRLGVPHLDDQQSLRPQVPARLPQNDPYGIQPRATRRERDPRLVTIFGRQTLQLAIPHIWRVRNNNIVAGVPQCAEVVRLQQPQAPTEAMAPAR